MKNGSFQIVVAVDGSELSRHALSWAIAFAGRTDAALAVCSAFDPMPVCIVASTGAPYDPGPMIAQLQDDAHRFCDAGVARAAAGGVAATSSVLEGVPSDAIVAFARREHADLVVLGTHARHGLELGIMGSVTEAIVRSCDAAVIAIRADTAIEEDGPVVVALDDSKASTAAGTFALRIAAALRVPIHLVHVAESADDHPAALIALAAAAALAAVKCTVKTRHGSVVAELIASASEHRASLLVTGTHGRGPVARLFLGSVADGLIRHSTIPVLTHRAQSVAGRVAESMPVPANRYRPIG